MVVSEEGFEPPTPWFVATCSNPLSYRPRLHWIYHQVPLSFTLHLEMQYLSLYFINFIKKTPKRPHLISHSIGLKKVTFEKGKGYRYRVLKKTTFEKEQELLNFFFILASSYFSVGLPLQYCHRSRVSPPSSGWIGVVPLRLRHQNINP